MAPGRFHATLTVLCNRCGAKLVDFERDTYPGADPALKVVVRRGGVPRWTTGPDGVEKVHLGCDRCPNAPQVRRPRVEAALDAVVAEHGLLGRASLPL